MTVRDLIVELLKYPMNAQVVMPKGSKNNEYHAPWSEVFLGCYIAEDKSTGDFYHGPEQCPTPEDGCIRAVFLSSE